MRFSVTLDGNDLPDGSQIQAARGQTLVFVLTLVNDGQDVVDLAVLEAHPAGKTKSTVLGFASPFLPGQEFQASAIFGVGSRSLDLTFEAEGFDVEGVCVPFNQQTCTATNIFWQAIHVRVNPVLPPLDGGGDGEPPPEEVSSTGVWLPVALITGSLILLGIAGERNRR